MYTIMQSPLPDLLDASSGNFENSKVYTDGKLYIYDKEIAYLNARLDIYLKASDKTLTWKVWTKMDANSFLEFGDNPNGNKGLIYANLCSDIHFYDETNGLEVLLDFKRRDDNFDPAIIILKSSKHQQLFTDFMNGIEEEKYTNWVNKINGHNVKA